MVLEDQDRVVISHHLDVLEDPSRTLELEDVRGPAAQRFVAGVPAGPDAREKHDEINFGFTSSAYWFRGAVHNAGEAPGDWLLELGYPLLDFVDFYIEEDDGSYARHRTGDHLRFDQRDIRHRHFLFNVKVPAGQTRHFYVRVATTSSVQLPVTLWDRQAFLEMDHTREMWLGLFIGLLGVMALYNLFVFAAVRDTSYVFYVLFVTSTVLWYLTVAGLTFEYLWPNHPQLCNQFVPFIVANLTLWALMFADRFLDLARVLPRMHQLNRALIALAAAFMLLSVVLPYGIAIRLVLVVGFLAATANFGGGIAALLKGNRSALLFVSAWSAFLLGTIMIILSKLGWLPRMFLTEYGQHIGSLVEVILLSFALADRINHMKAAVELHTVELQEKNAMLAGQAQALRDLDEQKTQFFQNISHELRTPLTLILNPLDSMAAEPAYAGERRLRVAVANSRRLLRLVNQLLDFQKLSAGNRDLDVGPIDLVAFARSTGAYFAAACARKSIRFEVLASGTPLAETDEADPKLWVKAERDALEKVAFNYLSNALKFTPAGRRIELRVEASERGARLAVVDEGPGLSDADQRRLFQVFAQAEELTIHQEEGTGLGLALVKELVSAMQGAVGVTSAMGAGATFWAELPGCEAPTRQALRGGEVGKDWYLAGALDNQDDSDSVDEAAAGPMPETAEAGLATDADMDRGFARELVLVVDDLSDMRRLIKDALEKHHYRVITAVNGARALEKARERRPDLIVSDWMMPVMSGPELVKALREDAGTRTVPIVLLTAKNDASSRMTGTEVGADAFVGKPFNQEELTCVVRNLLQLKARERKVEELNRHLSENVLKRYLAPSLVDAMLEGRITIDQQPKSVAATILFSELVGFGKATSSLRAPQMAKMLNDYLATMSSIVLEHGGTIDKFIGDTVMVLFGAPVAQKPRDQVDKAAACALAMQAAMGKVHERWRKRQLPCLNVRVAVHHGPVVVGNFGDARRYDYTAIGPSVNVGSPGTELEFAL